MSPWAGKVGCGGSGSGVGGGGGRGEKSSSICGSGVGDGGAGAVLAVTGALIRGWSGVAGATMGWSITARDAPGSSIRGCVNVWTTGATGSSVRGVPTMGGSGMLAAGTIMVIGGAVQVPAGDCIVVLDGGDAWCRGAGSGSGAAGGAGGLAGGDGRGGETRSLSFSSTGSKDGGAARRSLVDGCAAGVGGAVGAGSGALCVLLAGRARQLDGTAGSSGAARGPPRATTSAASTPSHAAGPNLYRASIQGFVSDMVLRQAFRRLPRRPSALRSATTQ